MTSDTPPLYEVVLLSEDNGLVGEEDTVLVVTLSMVRGGLVIMRGRSRTGKDEVVNAASRNFLDNGEADVFPVPNSTSPKLLFEKADIANACRVHRYPDMTDLPEHIEGLLKAHGEDEDFTHEWLEVKGGRSAEGRTIESPDCMIVFFATDNERFDLNDFPELRNRGLIVDVDGSKEQTERVNERQALVEAGLYEPNLEYDTANRVREHLSSLGAVVEDFGRSESQGTMMNPCLTAIDEEKPLPQHFPEARQDFPRLFKFMRSVCLYHHKERLKTINNKGEPVMMVTPSDCWLAMKIFGERMIMSALNLEGLDMQVLRLLRAQGGEGLSVNRVQQELREGGENVSDRDVKRSLKSMKTKGYVNKQKGKSGINEWSAGPFAAQVEHKASIDWEYVVEETKVNARKALDPDDANEYIEEHCEGDGLLVTHPFTGEVVNILEDTEFEDKIDEANDDMAEVFDEPVYGSSDDSEDTSDDASDEADDDDGLSAWTDDAAEASGVLE